MKAWEKALLVLGLAVVATLTLWAGSQLLGWWGLDLSGSASPELLAARDSIERLMADLEEREDSLDALTATHAAALEAYDSVATVVDSIQEEAGEDREEADQDVDSLATVIRARVDSATAVVVGELVESHDRALAAAAVELEQERRAHRAALWRARTAEERADYLLRDRVRLQAIVSQYELIERERKRQVRNLKWQRNGSIAAAVAALACAAAC